MFRAVPCQTVSVGQSLETCRTVPCLGMIRQTVSNRVGSNVSRNRVGPCHATEDIFSVATEDTSSVATEDISSVATEDISSVATEDMSSVATEDISSVATEDMSSAAAEEMSSVETVPNRVGEVA